MCGIIGIIDTNGQIKEDDLKAGTVAMEHRGPDGDGFYVSPDGHVALGHKRLSIIDVSGGTQPIHSDDGDYVAVVNGELYGYKAIREEFKNEYQFQTESDSEIVIPLYKKYGLDFVSHLRGEFAFVIYDKKKNLIVAGRDRFGIKPLYFHLDAEKRLHLASEAKAMFASGVEAEWDTESLFHMFSLQYLPQDRSLFKGVYQIKPGHILTFKNSQLEMKKYWDIDFPKESEEVEEMTEEEAETELERLLLESVELRLQSDDVPFCTLVSGGVDSSIIAGMAARLSPKKTHCFTVSFPHAMYDETPMAKEVAKHIGADFTPVVVGAKEIMETFEDAVYMSEGLAINAHLSAKYLLNKAVREAGYKFVLTGEGSDEGLAGYAHLRADLNPEEFSFRKQADGVVGGVHLAHGQTLDLSTVNESLGYLPSFLKAKASIGFKMHQILDDTFINSQKNNDVMKNFVDGLDVKGQMKDRNSVYKSSYLWIKSSLANYILRTLADGTEMAWSVEGRVPFLDHKVFEFVRNLPIKMKINKGIEKHILRKVATKYIPESVANRPKQSFMAPPLSLLLDEEGMSYFTNHVSSDAFKEMGFFNQEKTLDLLERIPKMSTEEQIAYEPVLMLMLSTYFAHKRFNLNNVEIC